MKEIEKRFGVEIEYDQCCKKIVIPFETMDHAEDFHKGFFQSYRHYDYKSGHFIEEVNPYYNHMVTRGAVFVNNLIRYFNFHGIDCKKLISLVVYL